MLNARLPQFIRDHYECHEWKHASAIPTQDFPSEWTDLLDVLSAFRLRKSWVSRGGGNKSQFSAFIDGFLSQRRWVEIKFSCVRPAAAFGRSSLYANDQRMR
jgi:Restriction endonuclease BglII